MTLVFIRAIANEFGVTRHAVTKWRTRLGFPGSAVTPSGKAAARSWGSCWRRTTMWCSTRDTCTWLRPMWLQQHQLVAQRAVPAGAVAAEHVRHVDGSVASPSIARCEHRRC
jgi:hypothetical protein